ncbi:MAG TPA: hypothetical protein RMH85_19930 [Polyangiaceae bacterium LLY-WYZ-15_(1-7)]|nr:hypothetical protein [Myxococcales bacterium]MAT27415.1 hypothetical protein [Sandaracinus sp.]HJL05568.1 hypothetical protein [Polyangiaceae bacterium LLY-WYZ-15_(1-7)]MBJ74573.1 hypothetical protein [Sandaracinus sp.]HJL10752.1 hypothetical protein [Polyangiaceae bacterium LLY-WYZ-15_(1-7)]
MPLGPHLRDSPAARELGSLALSVVPTDNPMIALRAAQWRNALTKVGLGVPFWAVHDLGMLTVVDPATVPIGPRSVLSQLNLAGPVGEALQGYTETLNEIAQSEVLEKARQWRLSDDLIAVLLLKVIGPLWERYRGHQLVAGVPTLLPLDPEIYRDIEPELPQLFGAHDRSDDVGFLQHVARERLRLITAVEQIDLDTLRLLGMFGAEASAAGALQMLDLLNVFESPEANDVVNFSLDLLPSVLETKRASGQQTFAVDGYSGVERRGTLDSLVLSELAFDEDLFDRRWVEKEVFFYAREKQHEEDRRLHYVMVDASASMRGQRSVFARGLALTLVKKLLLQGEDVYFRFFDSRLYEVQHARAGRSDKSGISAPYVLCFKGERGRNYAKVFGMLANELQRLHRRERRTPILYILTHAQCHVPLDTIERLRTIARLYGVFMLPSTGELDLEYLSRLHTVQVVDHDALSQKSARTQRALEIVDDATKTEKKAVVEKGEEEEEPRRSIPPGELV